MLLKIFVISLFFLGCQDSNLKIVTGQNTVKFNVEKADTDQKRQQGLMYRKDLAENSGMLFIFPNEEDHTFWMKNTLISLDLIFIDSNFNVVGTIENARILSEDPLTINQPSKYVLELKAGTVKKNNININSKIIISE